MKIESTNVTTKGLAMLAKLPVLEALLVRDTRLTNDEGLLTKAVQGLSATKVGLIRTGLERDQLQKLTEAIPPTKTKLHFGAFLGVGPLQLQGGDGCELGLVSPDSAAARAGLREGDTIVKYSGKAIENFDQLRDLISHDSPGDVVDVEIKRDKRPSRWLPDFDLQPNRKPPADGQNKPVEKFEVLVKKVKLGELQDLR